MNKKIVYFLVILLLSTVSVKIAVAFTMEEAVQIVEARYGSSGEIIGVSPATVNGVLFYRVVVLSANGSKRVHLVDAGTGQLVQ